MNETSNSTTIGAAFKVVGGGTPATANLGFWNGGIPWATSADLDDDLGIKPRKFITEDAVKSSATNLVPAGSVVVATRVGLGKVGVAPAEMAFSQDCQGVIVDPQTCDSRFVALQLKQRVQIFKYVSRGTTISGVTKKQLLDLPVELPSIAEQRRIVAEIEKQFTRLDAGVTALRRVQANLKRYRAAVLKAACEGRLVPTEAELTRKKTPSPLAGEGGGEGESYETGEQLLARILADRRKNWLASAEQAGRHGRGKYKEPVAPDTTNVPPLPEDWIWASPDQLSSAAAYALAIGPFGSNLKVSDYTDAGVPLVFVRNIRSAQFGGERTVFVSASKANELRAHYVSAGEILVTKMGEPPGEACLYPDSAPDAVITADCIKLRLAPILLQKRFFVHAINSEVVKPQIQLITKGVAQMKISLGRFSSLAIPMPPLAEQTRIVAEVERRLSVIEEQEAAVAVNLKRAARLRQSILARAFAG